MKVGKTVGVVGLLAAISLAMEGCDDLLCLMPGVTCDPPCLGHLPCPDPCWNAQPTGTVAVNFTIDATARPGLYHDQDFQWKGNFTYDGGTNVLTPLTGWAGPYAPLWDDGPWIDCGHEPAGAVKGDNKFGVAAWMTIPTTEITMEYGAQTKTGGWMWPPPNGSVVVPANSSTPVTAEGLTLPAPGTTDVKFMLDTTNLAAGFTYTAGQPIVVKGTYSWWDTDPLYDDGTHGDAAASNGVFTYTLSLNNVARAKPPSGTNQEFVFMINNVEYKTAGVAETTGVTAQTNTGSGWVNAPITHAANNNTQIAIP